MQALARLRPSCSRETLELLLALVLAGMLGLALGLIGGLSTKYQLAFVIGGVLVGVLMLAPERRIWCMALWVMIQPLSIEKVFYVNAISPDFVPQAVVVNAGDVLLLMMAGFMLLESVFTGRKVWYWPRFATLFGLYLLWAVISALIHATFLDSGHTGASPWALMTYARTLLFIVIVHSAIRTRAELVCLLLALCFIVFGEAILVGLSYATGEIFNFAKLSGQTPILELQTYSSGDGSKMVRGVGTLGHTNQQAFFHTFYTMPLIALFVVRNTWFRILALLVITASTCAVLMSFSRSAWMSYAFALLLAFGVACKRREIAPVAWLTGAGMAILGVFVLAALASPIYERIAHGDGGATDSRLRMIDLATDLYLAYPIIGVGPGEFSEASLIMFPPGFRENEWVALGDRPMVPEVGRLEVVRLDEPGKEPLTSPLPVHNKYMLTLSELGLVGLLLWLSIYYHLFREALFCSRARDPLLRFVGVGGMGAILASMSYMMLDLFADDKSLQILFFIPVLITACARIVRETESPLDQQERLTHTGAPT